MGEWTHMTIYIYNNNSNNNYNNNNNNNLNNNNIHIIKCVLYNVYYLWV